MKRISVASVLRPWRLDSDSPHRHGINKKGGKERKKSWEMQLLSSSSHVVDQGAVQLVACKCFSVCANPMIDESQSRSASSSLSGLHVLRV
ncbi:hypothetical protein BHM03_00006526 [Ensete ventricosum]|nr:hypothetical protein BHM03_00006526 [Ensete ventricosum]